MKRQFFSNTKFFRIKSIDSTVINTRYIYFNVQNFGSPKGYPRKKIVNCFRELIFWTGSGDVGWGFLIGF